MPSLRGGLCQTRDSPVERVEKNGPPYRARGVIEVNRGRAHARLVRPVTQQLEAPQRRHHREVAHADVGSGEGGGEQVETLLQPLTLPHLFL